MVGRAALIDAFTSGTSQVKAKSRLSVHCDLAANSQLNVQSRRHVLLHLDVLV
jgi:hypothetical protein